MRDFFNKVAGCAGYHTGPLSETEQLLIDWGVKFRKKWDGTVVVQGDLRVPDKKRDALPDFSNVIVQGTFSCIGLGLTSLKGSPKRVEGGYFCSDNNLTNLEGATQWIGDAFFCEKAGLESLEGGPRHVGRNFHCPNNRLKTLHGAPQFVGEGFNVENNELVSLEGAPEKTGGSFWCSHNKMTTLKGAPRAVGGSFWCNDNLLTSLEGGPENVIKATDSTTYNCSRNQLTSLVGVAKGCESIYADDNPLETVEGAPETGARIRCPAGDFYGWETVPPDLRYSPGTRERKEHERATVLQAPLRISRPLRLAR